MSAGSLELDGVRLAVARATLETYHDDTDWNLIGETADGRPLQISGTAAGRLAPGQALRVRYVDQPDRIDLAGQAGMLVTTPDEAACSITVASVDAAWVRLEAELVLEWVSLGWEGTPSRRFPIRLAIDAEHRRR